MIYHLLVYLSKDKAFLSLYNVQTGKFKHIINLHHRNSFTSIPGVLCPLVNNALYGTIKNITDKVSTKETVSALDLRLAFKVYHHFHLNLLTEM